MSVGAEMGKKNVSGGKRECESGNANANANANLGKTGFNVGKMGQTWDK